ncbi:hypothetical protein [Elstera cyanobacteriorum]|uniref:hypothetical protein n=1 Tax=Elstera cyanobacteriorum TaxID=2022747 RepID=UPI002357DEBF|nr:hypothetical protein [Elstera cyanobacteriorum]MCK6441377.1 hypothetical protein [Elstera cyanobacteriorum]
MAQDKQGVLERFSERYPVRSASVVALCFALVCLIGAYIALDETEILSLKFPRLSKIFPNKVNEWGDFLAGIFAPAALFFLALSVRIQSRELRAAVDAQQAMKSEMEAQVSQMKFAGMAPFFYNQAEYFYKKLSEMGIDEYFLSDFGIFNGDISISDFMDSKKVIIEEHMNDFSIIRENFSTRYRVGIDNVWGRDVLYLYMTFYVYEAYVNEFLNNYKSFEILFNNSSPEEELQFNFLSTRYSDLANKIIYLQLNHRKDIDKINEMINGIFEKIIGSRPKKVF